LKSENENVEYFKGSAFLSWRGLAAWSFPFLFLWLVYLGVDGFKEGTITPVAVFCFLWLSFNSFFLFYFGVSKSYMIVKNHTFFWLNKSLKYSDIVEVVFEKRGRLPNSLRITTKDFKSKIYFAGTLSDKSWGEMLTLLKKNKIKVRNEIVV